MQPRWALWLRVPEAAVKALARAVVCSGPLWGRTASRRSQWFWIQFLPGGWLEPPVASQRGPLHPSQQLKDK